MPKHFFPTALLYLLVFPFLINAQDGDGGEPTESRWSLGPAVGYSHGMAYEIVYDTSGVENQNDYLSLLTWELQNAFTVGVEGSWDSGGMFRVDFGLSTAVPGLPSGQMNDWDWFYTDRDWSHWSLSDIRLRWGFLADASAIWSVVDSGPFSLDLGAGYHMDWWAWKDSTVDSIYSTLNQSSSYYPGPFPAGDVFRDQEDVIPEGTSGIDYSVAYHSILAVIGMTLEWDVPFFSIRGGIGPTLAISHDYHKLRYLHFYDSGLGGPWMEVDLVIGFRTGGGFSAEIGGSWNWLAEMTGNDLVVSDSGGSAYYADAAGFSFYRWDVRFACAWALP